MIRSSHQCSEDDPLIHYKVDPKRISQPTGDQRHDEVGLPWSNRNFDPHLQSFPEIRNPYLISQARSLVSKRLVAGEWSADTSPVFRATPVQSYCAFRSKSSLKKHACFGDRWKISFNLRPLSKSDSSFTLSYKLFHYDLKVSPGNCWNSGQ